MADRLQQVRLAEAGTAVDEERVVGLGRRLRDGKRGRVREAVRRTDHEEVERVLRVGAAELASRPLDPTDDRRLARLGLRLSGPGAVVDSEVDARLAPDHVTNRSLDQPEKVPFDPLAGEVVRHRDREVAVTELEAASLREPRAVRRLVEGPSEPTGDLVPQALSRQLDWVLHPWSGLLSRVAGARA